MKINKILTKMMTLLIITGSIISAAILVQPNLSLVQNTYNDMNITQLQEEVENLSQNGNLPFDMGLELIERWTQKL